MNKPHRHRLALACCLALLLAACAAQPSPTAAPAVSAAAAPSPSSTAAPTPSPATAPATPTSASLAPTATATPVPPSATAAPRTPTATGKPPSPTVPAAIASPPLPPRIGGPGGPTRPEIERGNTTRRQVALTFDAGASAAPLAKILGALRQAGIRSTFFLTGAWAAANPDGVKAIVADGHEVFNHSQTHPDFTTLSDAEIAQELEATEQIIQKIAGRTTKPYFRPPYGARDKRVLAAAWAAGYRSVYWTVDSGDWREDATVDGVVNKILSNAASGAIFIEHVGSAQTAEGLPRIIAGLREKGYEIVPLSIVVQ